ncbi:LysR substrate-binding domain-containing protein [Telmatospirillum sp.]|uniref:LysR substrate-binding domain-containing protein n=1 Tax=Telmatospirillum sp. TaxID=2079197 RepID=UPI00284C73F9|nr:LysR substrate-binding domain-containing protein [Telmatospirillum sp.]MDR3437809.1 LysR substrate-binding domain-containing protein [Telmatospirillum sp.]
MEYRQLRYFIAVAEELNFSRAAVRLNVSQPPLSVQIKSLEKELGVSLFVRNRRSVALTAAGKLLLEHARKAVGEVKLGVDVVRRAARGEGGAIRIGFVDSVPMLEVFSGLLGGFSSYYPDVRLEMRHMSTGTQLEALSHDRLDVGFLRPISSFKPWSSLQTDTIWRDQLMLFVPRTHPLGRNASAVEVAELAGCDFVGVAEGMGCGVRNHVNTLCQKAGFMPHMVQEARELRTVLSLVSAGVGISILPCCYASAGATNVVCRPLATQGADSRVLLATRARDSSVPLRNFVDYARTISA